MKLIALAMMAALGVGACATPSAVDTQTADLQQSTCMATNSPVSYYRTANCVRPQDKARRDAFQSDLRQAGPPANSRDSADGINN